MQLLGVVFIPLTFLAVRGHWLEVCVHGAHKQEHCGQSLTTVAGIPVVLKDAKQEWLDDGVKKVAGLWQAAARHPVSCTTAVTTAVTPGQPQLLTDHQIHDQYTANLVSSL